MIYNIFLTIAKEGIKEIYFVDGCYNKLAKITSSCFEVKTMELKFEDGKSVILDDEFIFDYETIGNELYIYM